MRQITALLLALLLLPGVHALAANQMLLLSEENDVSNCVANGPQALYVLTINQALYRWQVGQDALEKLTPINSQADDNAVTGLCVIGDGLYARRFGEGELRLIYAQAGNPPDSIAFPLSRDVKGTGANSYVRGMLTQGDSLWFLLDKKLSESYILCRYDLTTKEITAYEESKGLYGYCPLPDGRVLLNDHAFEKGRLFGRFRMLDAASGKVSPFAETPDPVSSLAWDDESASVLYHAASALWRWNLRDRPERLADMPVSDPARNPGHMMDGKLAVIFSSGIYLCDPTADSRGSRGSLVIVDDSAANFGNKSYTSFMARHPDISLSNQPSANKENFSTGNLAMRIQTGDLNYDVMHLSTTKYDLPALIDRGYCADLSQDEELMALVQRMHPAIASEVIKDSKLYALPIAVRGVGVLSVYPPSYRDAGLTPEDMPQSYEALIALGGRSQGFGHFDGEPLRLLFPMADQAKSLKQFGIKHYIYDKMSRREALDFKSPTFIGMLESIDRQSLPHFPSEGAGVFSFTNSELLDENVVALSMLEGGPKVQAASLDLYIVNTKSSNQELARLYLKNAADALTSKGRAYLFADWHQAVENPGYADWLKAWQETEHSLLAQIESASGSQAARREAQAQLDHKRKQNESIGSSLQYEVSPEGLAHYQQQVAPGLFFPPPNVFTDWSQPTAALLDKEIQRYLKGQMSAQQLAASLDQMARLMELERQ